MDRLIPLYRQHFGAEPSRIVSLHPDGSTRRYYRLRSDRAPNAIGVIGPDHEENLAFLAFSRAFRRIGLPVPEIYRVGEGDDVYIEEDLGDETLFDLLDRLRADSDGSFPDAVVPVYRRAVEVLPRFQIRGGRVIDYARAYPRAAFDRQSILWDLNYFKYHFLKLAHIPFNEGRLEEDFHALATFLLQADTRHFLYRDFQSRNIMIRGGEASFIDYQGGRQGAPQYDIASLLYDAKAAIPEPIRAELLEHYLDALEEEIPLERDLFLMHFRGYVLVRILQAMGAYGYRGFFERKRHFLLSVPLAIRNIERLLGEGLLPIHIPELEAVLLRITHNPVLRQEAEPQAPGLTVRVGSFSYRNGLPEDETGHGGGFIFDCRAIPNPGKHEEYAALCGLDGPVEEFLQERPESHEFLASVQALVDVQVDTYQRRSFRSLTVDFGCTGGQHRSVYFAERLGAHLRERFPQITVRVRHRERAAWPRPAGAGRVETGAGAGLRH